jgi:hypothetical protein
MPHMRLGALNMEANLSREDLVVLDTVEGRSSIKTFLGGLIAIIDGEHLRLFGMSFFKDKYTYFRENRTWWDALCGVSVEDRAYYKALEQQPDADMVLSKSMDREESGVPFFFSEKEVTFRGKALKLKSNQ